MDNWIDFYRERRLGNMLRLVNDSSLNKLGERLLPKLGKFFEGVQVPQLCTPLPCQKAALCKGAEGMRCPPFSWLRLHAGVMHKKLISRGIVKWHTKSAC